MAAAKYERRPALNHNERRLTMGERFMQYVKKTRGEHWIWIGSRWRQYGQFGVGGQVQYAHTAAYQMWVGPIPAKHHVAPCSTQYCVNPKHQTLRKGYPSSWRRNVRAQLTDKQAARILAKYGDAYENQCNTVTLAREFGVTPELIGIVLRGHNGGVKLSRADCEEIRRRYSPRPPITKIAKQYGVRGPVISRLLQRKTYKNAA